MGAVRRTTDELRIMNVLLGCERPHCWERRRKGPTEWTTPVLLRDQTADASKTGRFEEEVDIVACERGGVNNTL